MVVSVRDGEKRGRQNSGNNGTMRHIKTCREQRNEIHFSFPLASRPLPFFSFPFSRRGRGEEKEKKSRERKKEKNRKEERKKKLSVTREEEICPT